MPPDGVHAALKALLTLPVILSRINQHVNLDKGKRGKSTTPIIEESLEVDNTPSDGVSDLPPAPIPESSIPSSELPLSAAPPRVAYDLPEGVLVEDCAIFYLGSESLGLNNLLITHGKCQVQFCRH